jgi:hypothetical protein
VRHLFGLGVGRGRMCLAAAAAAAAAAVVLVIVCFVVAMVGYLFGLRFRGRGWRRRWLDLAGPESRALCRLPFRGLRLGPEVRWSWWRRSLVVEGWWEVFFGLAVVGLLGRPSLLCRRGRRNGNVQTLSSWLAGRGVNMLMYSKIRSIITDSCNYGMPSL